MRTCAKRKKSCNNKPVGNAMRTRQGWGEEDNDEATTTMQGRGNDNEDDATRMMRQGQGDEDKDEAMTG